MAVTSPAPDTYVFTANGDNLLERIKVRGLVFLNGANTGTGTVSVNSATGPVNGIFTAATGTVVRSKVLAANETYESFLPIGWTNGLKVAMPTACVLVVHTDSEGHY